MHWSVTCMRDSKIHMVLHALLYQLFQLPGQLKSSELKGEVILPIIGNSFGHLIIHFLRLDTIGAVLSVMYKVI